jgi:hypothetical protein
LRRLAVVVAVVVAAVVAVAVAGCGRASDVVYAWDRPESLQALPPGSEVAVYRATVSLKKDDVVWRPRAHPVKLPDGARRVPVIHIEPGATRPLDLDLRTYLVGKMVAEAQASGALQLDYEAPLSERPFLRQLILDLRHALPRARLSMTALASWCLFDGWLAELPVDEVVPMVYRMGRDRLAVRRWLDEGRDFRVPLCQKAVAVSLADPPPRLPGGRRRYWFDPRSWTPADLERTR